MQTQGVGQTDGGRQRDRNEDTFQVDNELGLYLVCDGMGDRGSAWRRSGAW